MPDPAPQRLERLVRAGIQINAERELERVLQTVAHSARDVIEARYAALGVLNAERTGLATFVTSGLTPEEHARIGALPQGKGILGFLITEPKPLRLRDLGQHARSYGFPPNHPRMRSFLGVPVVGRHGPIGNLYLTEKISAPEFTEEDQTIAIMLAAQAAGAVDNARLNEETERLLAEVRSMQKSRDRFYAMINHELRNALTAVYGWSELLLRRERDNPSRAAQEVFDSAERTLTLLNDLLDLSRLDASRLRPVVRQADIGEVIGEASMAVEPSARARGIHLEIRDVSEPAACQTDAARLRQILVNLLTNAVRHSPENGAVVVEVRPAGTMIRVDVIDHGEGMSADQQAVVFDAFTRGSENERGTGLGLTLSRQLARLLGGDLHVESTTGAGSRFILEIARSLEP